MNKKLGRKLPFSAQYTVTIIIRIGLV